MWSAQGRFRNGSDLSLGPPLDWRRADIVLAAWPDIQPGRTASREEWDRAVLAWLRQPDAANAQALRQLSLSLARGQADLAWRAFCKIAAAFFELRSQLAPLADAKAKTMALQILLQCAALLRHEPEPSHDLALALLQECQHLAAHDQEDGWQVLGKALGAAPAAPQPDWLGLADPYSRQLESMLSAGAQDLPSTQLIHAASLAWALSVGAEDQGLGALSDYCCQLALALQAAARKVLAPYQARVLASAAQHLRHLLHQQAAGIAKTPQEDLLQALRDFALTAE